MLEDAGGVELVENLGESDAEGRPKVAPWAGNAHVPQDVNFYEMGRHPWEDTPSSWRRDGFTEPSKAYFEAQFREAEKALYEDDLGGPRRYWPSKDAVESTHSEVEERGAELLQRRLYGELARAKRGVEPWAANLREKALEGKLPYRLEVATQAEKIYDDEYYRWFINPGHHPNPSGLTLGRPKDSDKSIEDRELERFLNTMLAGATLSSSSEEGEKALGEFAEEDEDEDATDTEKEKPDEDLV
ncbi:unnamed protein product [Phytomonas sp. Hart1]|nr:unnamed protein product [Phytomonas sp. Hart1]|eukprot:CCW69294.1 unnamed protein product [Phytomonas sp. isolate Hart1]